MNQQIISAKKCSHFALMIPPTTVKLAAGN